MRSILTTFALAFLLALSASAQPKREIRSVWLTTNNGLDWPSSTFTINQKRSLTQMLDKLQKAHFNTVLLQVQCYGDVLWDSSYQPSMRVFTEDGSTNLTWDVSRFVIDECHKRGMECHAWIVPYRIGSAAGAEYYAQNPRKHILLTHPEWTVLFNNQYYLDPGLPEVRSYLLDVYREMIENYDFDGSNFDYTRYPGADFDDNASYARYGNNMDRGDWRRQNINTFVHAFYDMAKEIKPGFKVGCAPIGTYKRAPGYSNMEAYGVYQDPVEWVNAGKHDLVVPQLYWNEKYGFTPHMEMWAELTSCSRHFVAGLAPYKMLDTNDWDVSVITDQIEKARAARGYYGACFFRTQHVIGPEERVKQLYTELSENYYKYPANIPPMEFNGITRPNSPQNVNCTYADGKYTLTWDAPEPDDEDTPIKYYCVYNAGQTSDIENMENCVGHYITENSFTFSNGSENLSLAVTAFDVNYYESDPVIVIPTGIANSTFIAHALDITQERISAEFESEIATVKIVSTQGMTVASCLPGSNSFTLSIASLRKGVYLLTVKDVNGKTFTRKFVR